MRTVTENVEVAAAREERRAGLFLNSQQIDSWPEADVEDAKAKARSLRRAGLDVTLKWLTVQVPASVYTPLAYAYLVEYLAQDEANMEEHAEVVGRFGEPDWDLIDVDRAARRRAGLAPLQNWPPDLNPVDFGGVPLVA